MFRKSLVANFCRLNNSVNSSWAYDGRRVGSWNFNCAWFADL